MADYALACGHAETAAAAESVLNAGGTAADAAIAGAFMAMVAEPVLAGLLGGGFAMVADADETKLLDFFVHTPRHKVHATDFRSVFADFGATTQEFHIGAGAIATPGVAAGLIELHARAGHIPFRELVEPAIRAARNGIAINEFHAGLGRIVEPILMADASVRHLMCDEQGPLTEGALYRNPAFADVLEVYGIEGDRFVTEGEVAHALVELCREGGHLSAADLKSYRPVWRTPLDIVRGDARLSLNPAPGLGGTLIAFALELAGHCSTPLELARLFAATSRARLETGDDPVELLSPSLLNQYRKTLEAHAPSSRGTTHLSIIDTKGLGVALTLSNGEGCGLIVPGTGIMPNNMLGEEDLVPEGWQSWTPDTRLASMMCPLAARWRDGRLVMLGSGGSNRIRTALSQVLLHLIDDGRSIEDAVNAPRLHVEGDRLDFELTGLREEDRVQLVGEYREATAWPEPSMFFGGAHGVMCEKSGALTAAGDLRRAGVALPAAHSVAR